MCVCVCIGNYGLVVDNCLTEFENTKSNNKLELIPQVWLNIVCLLAQAPAHIAQQSMCLGKGQLNNNQAYV